MFRELLVLMAVTSVAMAAAYIQPLEEKPEEFKDVPGCYISDLKDVIPVGESRPSMSQCKSYICGEKNVQVYTCGAAAISPPCKLEIDKSQPYPNCCPKPVCPPAQNTACD